MNSAFRSGPWAPACIPSSSLLMHQKLSASMLRNTSCDRFVTSKFSTSSSEKQNAKRIPRAHPEKGRQG